MLGKHSLLVLIFFFVIIAFAKADLKEYDEVKEIIEKFDSLDSEPANIFSVYSNEDITGLNSRYQFFKDLNTNQENILRFGDFPYKPIDSVNKEEYKTLEDKAIENRNNIVDNFQSIEKALNYLNDIFYRYQFMKPNDRKEQSSTVIKYILGEFTVQQDSLPYRLPILLNKGCLTWLDSELHLLSFQYENNDPQNTVEFDDYSLINLAQCLNYLTAGYSMVVSAYKSRGDEAKAKSYFNEYSSGIKDIIANHEETVRKKSFTSSRKVKITTNS